MVQVMDFFIALAKRGYRIMSGILIFTGLITIEVLSKNFVRENVLVSMS